MPEYPDIEAYRWSLEHIAVGSTLETASIRHPFLLRTVDPAVSAIEGMRLLSVERVAKQLAFGFEGDIFAVLHLMIAGRLKWSDKNAKIPGKTGLAVFRFGSGSLVLTEAGTKRRAALRLVRGRRGLASLHPGGVDVFAADESEFFAALTRENRTIKRALTDQRLIAGIGNAYSDEILHAARRSPFSMTGTLTPEDSAALLETCRAVLDEWRKRLTPKKPGGFPKKVTAFQPQMAVHGKFGQPCPQCGTAVQRIRYADNESNYCPTCQTGGQIYSDRALARLLKDEWPRTLDQLHELEERNASRRTDC